MRFFPWSNFSPLSLSPALWLDASDASTLYDATSGGSLVAADGTIARWEDKSGNARHATQSTSGSRPLRKTSIQNSKDVARFDGVDDTLQVLSTYSLATYDIYVVGITRVNNVNGKALYGHGTTANNATRDALIYLDSANASLQRATGASFPTATIASTVNSFFLLRATFSGTNLSIQRNGVLSSLVATTIAGSTTDAINIGAVRQTLTTTFFHDGDIAEIIVYPSELSATNRTNVENFLNQKWAIY